MSIPHAVAMHARQAPSRSLFRPGENCCSVAQAGRVALLVDAAAYFEAFRRAAERAQSSILILAWDFNSQTPLAATAGEPTVGDFLNGLAEQRRQLHIRILDWDFPLIFQHDREFPPIFGLGWKPHRRVHFRYDATHTLAGSQHQKIAIIDDRVAFIGGLDLAARRWDTPEHRPGDPRRVVDGQPYPPFHDVMAAVDGEAARALAEIARKRWEQATGETLRPLAVREDPWPDVIVPELRNVRVGVACTAPAMAGDKGVRDVEQLYIDMIQRAERYIYIENQYFTSQSIGRALAGRLGDADGPEIVVVTRLLSHGWLEEVTMHALRTRLLQELRAADRHGRLRVYYPHTVGLAPGTCIDIHSKVMIVDDEWLRVGSANVSNRSMGLDSECDIVVEAEGRAGAAAAIHAFRDRLLGEHLGVGADEVDAAVERAGGLHAAIAELRREERTLLPLEDLPEWSDATLAAVAVADPERPVSLETLVDQFAPGVPVERAVSSWHKAIAGAALLLALALLWRFTPLAELASAEAVAAWARDFGARWWAGPLLVLAYTPASLIVFPRALLTVAAVLAFGPWIGFLCAVVGNLLAALATYLAGRLFRRDQVRAIAGVRLNSLSHALTKRGLVAITAIRLVPVAPFAVENVVAGAIRIPLGAYMLGTFLGMLPGELASTIFGRQLQVALLERAAVDYWLVATVVILLAVGAFAMRRVWTQFEKRAVAVPASAPETPTACP
jgi:phospholipase D1/2